MQIVLEGSTSEKKFALGMQFTYDLRELTVLVLDFVCFINYDVVPFNFFQTVETDTNSFKTCYYHIEFAFFHHVGQNLFSFITSGDKLYDSRAGHPFFKLVHPITEGNLRRHYNVRSTYLFEFFDKSQDGDCLDGLAQSHVICQNSTDAALVETDHPV